MFLKFFLTFSVEMQHMSVFWLFLTVDYLFIIFSLLSFLPRCDNEFYLVLKIGWILIKIIFISQPVIKCNVLDYLYEELRMKYSL